MCLVCFDSIMISCLIDDLHLQILLNYQMKSAFKINYPASSFFKTMNDHKHMPVNSNEVTYGHRPSKIPKWLVKYLFLHHIEQQKPSISQQFNFTFFGSYSKLLTNTREISAFLGLNSTFKLAENFNCDAFTEQFIKKSNQVQTISGLVQNYITAIGENQFYMKFVGAKSYLYAKHPEIDCNSWRFSRLKGSLDIVAWNQKKIYIYYYFDRCGVDPTNSQYMQFIEYKVKRLPPYGTLLLFDGFTDYAKWLNKQNVSKKIRSNLICTNPEMLSNLGKHAGLTISERNPEEKPY